MSVDLTAIKETIPYGCEQLGRLKCVLLHRPGKALELINQNNYKQMLFDKVPDVPAYVEDHDRYRELLQNYGVDVIELADYVFKNRELMDTMANLTFLHDTAVICRHGAIISKMAFPGRRNEHIVVKEALQNMGIPTFLEFVGSDEYFEGCLLLSEDIVLVAETERHTRQAIMKFISYMTKLFKGIIYIDVPKGRRYMHPDTVFNRVRKDLAIAYLPAVKSSYFFTRYSAEPINLLEFINKQGMDIIEVSDDEQRRLACSFVPLDNGVMLHYDTALDKSTCKKLESKGVELVLFHPNSMHEGGGSLRCHTLRIRRE